MYPCLGSRPAGSRAGGQARGASSARLATAVLAAATVALAGCSSFDLLSLPACSGEERRVFAEVTHFEGRRLEPSGNADAGSCAAYYDTDGTHPQVLAHYRRQLTAQGWTVEPVSVVAGGRQFQSGELRARRGRFGYLVLYESGPAVRAGTHVAVHVGLD